MGKVAQREAATMRRMIWPSQAVQTAMGRGFAPCLQREAPIGEHEPTWQAASASLHISPLQPCGFPGLFTPKAPKTGPGGGWRGDLRSQCFLQCN